MIIRNQLAGALAALALLLPAGCAAPVRQQAPATTTLAPVRHERLLPLQGGRNFRDLGGYATADGRTVKWDVLFRSGSMTDLTTADFSYLSKLGLRTVCDFRDNRERKDEPVAWPDPALPHILANDYKMDLSALGQLAAPGITADKARTLMAQMYRDLPYQFADQYKRMFGELLAGHAPLAFNCSAGKDRTGVAAALLLSALGVPRETVFEDFLLSNRYYKPATTPKPGSTEAMLAKMLPPDVIPVLTGVDRSFLEAALDSIDSRSGGLAGYFHKELGLTDADLEQLRTLYLERTQ